VSARNYQDDFLVYCEKSALLRLIRVQALNYFRKKLIVLVELFGYPLKAGQFQVKPFVVSVSNHDRLNRPPFGTLRANG